MFFPSPKVFIAAIALAALGGRSLSASASEICVAENLALSQATALKEASKNVEKRCQPTDVGELFITYSYDECEEKEAFSSACAAAGGKMIEYDVDIKCQGDGGDIVAIAASNVPECIGSSCDDLRLVAKNRRVFGNLERELEDFGFACSIGGESMMQGETTTSNTPTIAVLDVPNPGPEIKTKPATNTPTITVPDIPELENEPETKPQPELKPEPQPAPNKEPTVSTQDQKTDKPTEDVVVSLVSTSTATSITGMPTLISIGLLYATIIYLQ